MNQFKTDNWNLIVAIAIALPILYAQITYWVSLYKRKVKPSYLSWLGWGILMGTSLVGQFLSHGWTVKIIALLISTMGCMVIGLSARLIFNHYSYRKGDLKFIIAGAACMLIYLVLRDEWLVTIVAILADAMLAIPTIINAVRKPQDEKTTAWMFALASWILTFMLVLTDFTWLHMLWPIYLMTFNLMMIYLTYIRPALQKQRV